MGRLQLQSILESITPNVYFQPPGNKRMAYPCIVYERDTARTEFADDVPYRFTWRYTVTVIAEDPDSEIPEKVAALPRTVHNRFYVSENLNHDVFNVYF